jgi:Tfp pilus assembly protein PilO
MDGNGKNVRWIIIVCLTATLAVVGWTVTATLMTRMKAFETIEKNTAELRSNVMANNVRLSVLENRYDTIMASLADIKALLRDYQLK